LARTKRPRRLAARLPPGRAAAAIAATWRSPRAAAITEPITNNVGRAIIDGTVVPFLRVQVGSIHSQLSPGGPSSGAFFILVRARRDMKGQEVSHHLAALIIPGSQPTQKWPSSSDCFMSLGHRRRTHGSFVAFVMFPVCVARRCSTRICCGSAADL
jgi:hypothetical protein